MEVSLAVGFFFLVIIFGSQLRVTSMCVLLLAFLYKGGAFPGKMAFQI